MDFLATITRAGQQPDWPDAARVDRIREIIRARPPLVAEAEVAALRARLAAVERREAIVLQAGDCAELFRDASKSALRKKIGQLHDLAARLRTGLGTEVVAIGRIAGQYAKPRTSPWEGHGPRRLPSYRGDAVNGAEPDPAGRVPDPVRLLQACDAAEAALREIRLSWIGRDASERVYASHELLLLDYEIPLARKGGDGLFAGSAHTGWIGERTREPDGAHIAFAESIANPVGVKIGPGVRPDEAVDLSRRLNPDGEPGRLAFITRMGADGIGTALPAVAAAMARHGAPVIWLCDPMHANTFPTAHGRKTRAVSALHAELAAFVRILRRHGQWPGGVHLELTPEDVTECVATPADTHARLPRYLSACDPRLNPEQAEELLGRLISLL